MKQPSLVLKKSTIIDHVATGKLVRKYRESLNLTQAMVAAQLGQAYETVVSDLERGARTWTQEKLVRILDAIAKCK